MDDGPLEMAMEPWDDSTNAAPASRALGSLLICMPCDDDGDLMPKGDVGGVGGVDGVAEGQATPQPAPHSRPATSSTLRIARRPPRRPADQLAWRGDAGATAAHAAHAARTAPMSPARSYKRWVEEHTGRALGGDVRGARRAGDVVRGTWTCCKQVAPHAAGCLTGPHAFEFSQCAQCGEWVHVTDWAAKGTCRYHPAPPTYSRWGAAHFRVLRRGRPARYQMVE